MSPAKEIDLSNETLVAYLDGELGASEMEEVKGALTEDEEARQRLTVLEQGGRSFDKAFDELLDAAPEAELQAMFADLMAKRRDGRVTGTEAEAPPQGGGADENVVPLRRPPPSSGRPIWQMAAAAAVLVFVFAGGMVTGGLFQEPQQGVNEQQVGWREAAARYVQLFSQETLQGFPENPQERQANLERIETALGLTLSADRIEAPDMTFQGSQLLKLKDKALAQIAYLHNGSVPVALCIISSSDPSTEPAREQRQGLNVVHWVSGGYGFMVIGDVPDAELEQISASFRQRFL